MKDEDPASPNARDEDDEDDYEEGGGGNRLLGFMFGNVDGSGDLDVDYLDEDAKEHISALADKLGPSLKEIDLSIKSSRTSGDAEQDYDEKAEDAVDYEDIDEQYEGPEIQAASEEDYLLPKQEYFSTQISLPSLDNQTSIFDDENYDDEEEFSKEHEVVENNSEAQIVCSAGTSDEHTVPPIENQKSDDEDLPSFGSFDAENASVALEDLQEEEHEVLQESFDGKKGTPLPVLCIEDGMVVLRFSEIFGVHKPLKKGEVRDHHKYSILRERFKAIDVSDAVEEDEEAFLKGSFPGTLVPKPSSLAQGDYDLVKGDDVDQSMFDIWEGAGMSPMQVNGQRKDSCLSAQPMKEGMEVDLSAGWQSPSCPRFYPLEQQDWENGIIWGNSPLADHESSDSCVPSEPESFADAVIEEEAGPKNMGASQIEPDEKDHNLFLRSCNVLVEPFGSREFSELSDLTSSEKGCHPQILRLELQSRVNEPHCSDESKDNGNKEHHMGDAIRRLSMLSLQNKELLEGSWVDQIIWESSESIPKPKLILDLQDEKMLFEISDNKDGRHLRSHAGAMIVSRSTKSGPGITPDPPGQGGTSLGRFNISNDKYYSNRKISQPSKSHAKKRVVHGVKIMHSVPAMKLQTMKPKLSNKDIANFHRPKALWYPHDNEVAAKEQGKLSTQGPMKIILKSMGGKGSKLHVDAQENVSSVKAKASKKLDFKPSEKVKVFYSGKELEDDKSLAMQNVRPNSILHLVRTKIHLWPKAQKLPGENKPLRPPGAFKKKSELSVKDGHVFLMEYCEERPLLLGNIGMGARLCAYYQKSGPGDQTAALLRSGRDTLGTVLTLDPADKSPFLGDIKPGSSQSCLETNMYRAPIFPHKLASTDYLLVRSAKGRLSLRRIDKIYVVGQQEPHMEVISPGSKALQIYIGNRLLVYLYREFRANEKPGSQPFVRADELSALFPNLSEAFLRKRLKHCAELQRELSGDFIWVMKRGFRIPSEEELRRMVTPEDVCAYESMLAGIHRLKRLGISRLTHPSGLSSAMNQLPDEAIALAAASHIERELQITSWNLSSNFVTCTNQDRENIERLEITGVGDPSGRGLGFSYVRVAPKVPISGAVTKKKAAVIRGAASVTGTDADLRRLSMDAAREVLLKFNVPEEQIEKMTRWHRIAMVRKLSSEQAASGVMVDAATLNKFARGQRMSFLQLQQQTREKCQEIWDRQFQSLSAADGDENETDSEANSDLDSFAGDLENLLDAEECEDGMDGNLESKRDKLDGVRGLKMRRHPSQAQAEEEIEDEAAEAAELCRMLMDDDEAEGITKKKIKTVGKESGFGSVNFDGTKKPKKIVKKVIHNALPDGSFTSQEIIISDPKEVANILAKQKLSGKVKGKKGIGKNDLQLGLLKKKAKDVFKVFKEKKHTDKPVRDNFVCGACGQMGHMRTNKNCPKYGEVLTESQVDNAEKDNISGKPHSVDASTPPQPKPSIKKLVPKGSTKMSLVEVSESTENSGSKLHVKDISLKIRCSGDKSVGKNVLGPQTLDKQIIVESETSTKSANKINKIKFSSKPKSVGTPSEPQKPPSVVIRPPVAVDRDQHPKKIVFKQPKAVNNVEQVSIGSGVDEDFRRTKRIDELSSFDVQKKPDTNIIKEATNRRAVEERWLEEEEKRRNKQRMQEEEARMIYVEKRRLQEEQQQLMTDMRWHEAFRMEREERQKAKKKKKKKKPNMGEEYYEEHSVYRNDRRDRDRAAKRRPPVGLGRYAAENASQTKRRRGGEVVLSNILDEIVKSLRETTNISYLFLKPVSKKEAPDYLDIIDRPMDLSTITEKVRRMEYRSREDFRHDVFQIAKNAHLYNDRRNPGIPPLADQLLELCDYMLDQKADLLDEAECGIE